MLIFNPCKIHNQIHAIIKVRDLQYRYPDDTSLKFWILDVEISLSMNSAIEVMENILVLRSWQLNNILKRTESMFSESWNWDLWQQTSTMDSNSATTSCQSVDKMTGHDKKSSLDEGSLLSTDVPTSLKKFRMSSSSANDGFESTWKECTVWFSIHNNYTAQQFYNQII